MSKYPVDLIKLMTYLKKLPGVGSKTAERFAFQLLTWQEEPLADFADLLKEIKIKIQHCPECHCLMDGDTCAFCQRTSETLCIIASAKDAYAIEETRAFRGYYHVIGGLLSPIDGRHPDFLRLDEVQKRIEALQIKEIIIALDSTLEGDTTSLYLKEKLSALGLSVTRLAFGLPMGSPLDFVDGGTLARAFTGRQIF